MWPCCKSCRPSTVPPVTPRLLSSISLPTVARKSQRLSIHGKNGFEFVDEMKTLNSGNRLLVIQFRSAIYCEWSMSHTGHDQK